MKACKRIFGSAVLLILLVMIALTGCGRQQERPPADTGFSQGPGAQLLDLGQGRGRFCRQRNWAWR